MLLDTILGCLWRPPWGCLPEKNGFFSDPKGVGQQLCFPRVIGDQIGGHLDVFGRVPDSLLPPLSEFSCPLERTHSIYMPYMYISSAFCISDTHVGISVSDMHLDHVSLISISDMHNCACNGANKIVLLPFRSLVALLSFVARSLVAPPSINRSSLVARSFSFCFCVSLAG